MSTKTTIIFMICQILIGIGTIGLFGLTIKAYFLYTDARHLALVVCSGLGSLGHLIMSLYFAFHKDFRKE